MKNITLFLSTVVLLQLINLSGISQDTTHPICTVDSSLLLHLVNQVRLSGCQCGDKKMKSVPPVEWDKKLQLAAQLHSNDMYENNFFDHISPDGSTLRDRLVSVGFETQYAGENISKGHDTEKQAIEGWLGSPGHCENIMEPGYTKMGVARKGKLWTMDLGN